MKYSFMSFSAPKLEPADIVAAALKYGYAGFEPRLGAGHCHGVEESTTDAGLKQIAQRFAGSGVKICCLATSYTFADPEKAKASVEGMKRCIEAAALTGAPCVRVFGGAIPKELEREAAINGVAEALLRLSRAAQDSGVCVCLETHDDWCDPEHVASVMRAVNSPAVAVTWDLMHPVLTAGYGMAQAYEILKPWVKHVHFHDGTRENGLTFLPIGTGPIDHKAAVELLMSGSYGGYLSGEWINWEPFDIHLPREIQTMKQYEVMDARHI